MIYEFSGLVHVCRHRPLYYVVRCIIQKGDQRHKSIFSPLCNAATTVEEDNWIDQVIVSDSNGDFVPINIEDIAQVVEVDEDGSTHRTCLKENSTDPLLGNIT